MRMQLIGRSMFPAVSPELTSRVSLQVKSSRVSLPAVSPELQATRGASSISAASSSKAVLYLARPRQTTQQMANWHFQLSSACWFLQLLWDRSAHYY